MRSMAAMKENRSTRQRQRPRKQMELFESVRAEPGCAPLSEVSRFGGCGCKRGKSPGKG